MVVHLKSLLRDINTWEEVDVDRKAELPPFPKKMRGKGGVLKEVDVICYTQVPAGSFQHHPVGGVIYNQPPNFFGHQDSLELRRPPACC